MENIKIPLDFYKEIPAGFQSIQPEHIRNIFPNPSIIHLEGKIKEPVFISTMLHGNEHTSFIVLKKLTEYLQNHVLNRSIIIFVGNVFATEKNIRHLDSQRDYNRSWNKGETKEQQLCQEVINYIKKQKKLFASIDIHNNTGANPLYACISKLEAEHSYLASLFSKTIVYFKRPESAQSVVFSQHTPAITIECGQSKEQNGINRAYQFILDVINLDTLRHNVPPNDIRIFHTVGQLYIKDTVEFHFEGESNKSEKSLVLPKNFEQLNFSYIDIDFLFARYDGKDLPFYVLSENGEDITSHYFSISDKKIMIKKAFFASMFTKDKKNIAQDCLGYFMEEVHSR